MIDIALVNCCIPIQDQKMIGAPQSSLALATYLRNYSGAKINIYDTSVDICSNDFTPDGLFQYLSKIEETIIGISVWDSVLPKVLLAAHKLKNQYPHKILILGGPTISSLGFQIIEKFNWIDFIVEGEGEQAFVDLFFLLDKNSISYDELPNNVKHRTHNGVRTGKNPFCGLESDKIPVLDYSILRNKYYRYEIVTSRGCPFQCKFCSVNNSWKNGIRYRNIEDIYLEIESIKGKSEIDSIHIVDDNFASDKKRFWQFCNGIQSRFPGLFWSCFMRVEDLSESNIDRLTDAGCMGVFVGIESGNPIVRKNFGKSVDNSLILRNLISASQNIGITASFIWGYPDESISQFQDTLLLIDALVTEADDISIHIYQLAPLSGTKIIEEMKNLLHFDERYVSHLVYPPYLPELTDAEKILISQYPELFSSFYYPKNKIFFKKRMLLEKFLNFDQGE